MNFHTFINKMGTTSLFCDDIGDIYYSYIGAYKEAMQKFVIPACEENFSDDIKILDICYGLGFNSKAFVNYFLYNKNFDKRIYIDAIEFDKRILALSLLHRDNNISDIIHNKFSLELLKADNLKKEVIFFNNNPDFKDFINYPQASLKFFDKSKIIYKKNSEKSAFVHNIYYQPHSKRLNFLLKSIKNINISFKIKDLLSELPDLKHNSYDLIFHDGFSPSKQPELWSEEVFSYIYNILKPNGKILTYTKSNIVRKTMLLSGLEVFDIYDENDKVVGTIGKKVK